MLHVSAGHEKGIGLEVFLKSFLCLSSADQNRIVLHANSDEIKRTASTSKIILPKTLNIVEASDPKLTLTLSSLFSALDHLKTGDSLFTLPTSKDQLKTQGNHHLGYTEFLRSHFNEPRLVMTFKAPAAQIALLTDHVSLKNFIASVNTPIWSDKLRFLVEHTTNYYKTKDIYISGVNPHAGEGGLLGDDEVELSNTISELQKNYPLHQIAGPLPADTMHFKSGPDTLLVFLYHDQGLSWFKGMHGLIGANITLGLPFIRLSVDHGTAFELYGKNCADYRGCLYALRVGLKE